MFQSIAINKTGIQKRRLSSSQANDQVIQLVGIFRSQRSVQSQPSPFILPRRSCLSSLDPCFAKPGSAMTYWCRWRQCSHVDKFAFKGTILLIPIVSHVSGPSFNVIDCLRAQKSSKNSRSGSAVGLPFFLGSLTVASGVKCDIACAKTAIGTVEV